MRHGTSSSTPRKVVSSHIQSNLESALSSRYNEVRGQSLALCAPLETEDYQVQPMADASPPKWHLAHVTWFFETFILRKYQRGYVPFHPAYEVLFNSYYNGVGEAYPRSNRGSLSRPTLEDVFEYRRYVDDHMQAFLNQELSAEMIFSVELGLNHEQQHQELILTDLKYNLGSNPLKPAYIDQPYAPGPESGALTWSAYEGGLIETGNNGDAGFVFDNETPVHKSYLEAFELADRTVTNREFLAFIEDDGYSRSELWLSDGWAHLNGLQEKRWQAPLYWRELEGKRLEYTLTGERQLNESAPVCHVSGYEADAYARWAGARLPTEEEWEHAASGEQAVGNFVENRIFHPVAEKPDESIGLFGNVWEWTSSSYSPYPAFVPFAGQLGEYNGKFMANQLVLKGGSCATPQSHIRASYRNFFYPPDRWQFTGIRLARSVTHQ